MWSINGIEYDINNNSRSQVLIDACSQLGYDIPRFCYHESLKIAGNCRMCLIEDSKSPKPVICCALNVSADLSIFTNTVQVKKSRESVMEFLLINHPLDCPICDQGGECDLQDLSLVYGADHGRFYDYKRNVEDKDCGSIVKTVMNRCIACTRCVRFATDVAGFESFGLTGRGTKMEIGSYIEKIIDTELSGNLVDVCPVGALTSKPYAFSARPWELKKLTSYALFDEQPQLIRLDIKEGEILRVLPAKNNFFNTWITNRTRFSYEGLSRARILDPKIFGIQVSWEVLFRSIIHTVDFAFGKELTTNLFSSFLADHLSFSDLLFLKSFTNNLAASPLNFFPFSTLSNHYITFFLKNPLDYGNFTQKNLLLLNINLSYDAPIFNSLISSINEPKTFILWNSSINSVFAHTCLLLQASLNNLFSFVLFKLWSSIFLNDLLCLYNSLNSKLESILRGLFIGSFSSYARVSILPLYSFSIQRDLNTMNTSAVHYSANVINKESRLIDWFWNTVNLYKTKKLSIFSVSHSLPVSATFTLPAKPYFETSDFIVLTPEFRLLKLPGTPVATKSYAKSHNKLINMFKYLLKVPKILVLLDLAKGDLFSKNHFETNFFHKKIAYFSSFAQFGLKLTTKIQYYSQYPLTAVSPTLLNLAKASPFKSIY